jgi:hypothetical protein
MTGNLLRTNNNLPIGINIVIGACEDTEGKEASTSGNLILFVWNDLDYHTIWRYSTQDLSYTKILESSILNFKLDYPIYHSAVVNNLLYWTDNYFNSYEGNDFNPPRKINIEKAILYTESGGTDPNGYSEITFDNLDWIKHPPLFSPEPEYFTDTTETANNLKNKLFQFRYQYIYDDNEESAWSPISIMALPPSGEYISQTVNIDPFIDNTIKLDISTGSSIVRLIRVAYRIGNTGEFFLYKEYDKLEEGWDNEDTETITFKNETSGPAISNSERNYDLIPQVAKAIEYLPSNEFAIGNYVEGYDKIEISETDFSFSQSRSALNKINSFTRPTAVFWNLYNLSGARNQVISFYAHTDSPSLFFKYKIAEGDVLILQLKEITSGYVTGPINNILPTIYYTVPNISGTTDLDYMNNLCIDLSNYLESIGIPSSVSPAGTYTINSVSITWPTVSIDWGTFFPITSTSYTWFNFTESQLDTSNSTNYTQNITILRKNESTRTFKTGATHEFAIQYYDRANRDGTVQIVPTGSVYVPFNTDLSNNELNLPSGLNRSPYSTSLTMNIDADFIPPMWATNYQILYKPSTNIANFQQRSVNSVVFNPDSTINLLLDNYYKNNNLGASINQTPSKGDFVRLVRQRTLFNKEKKLIGLEEANNEPLLINHLGSGNYAISLSPFYSSIYDPSGIFSSGVFIAPSTGTYTLKANLLLTLEFPTGYYPTSINGGIVTNSTVVGSDVFDTYSNSNVTQSQITINIEGQVEVALTSGDDIEVLFTFVLTGTPFPSLLSATLINSQFSVMFGNVDYGDYKYFPKYMTSDNSNALELNVLSYNPGDDNESESITVNYFDPSLLGDYLSYTGTNEDRGFASGGFQIEIYTPKKQSENDPWFETGIEFPILNAHTEDRVHAGDVNQVLNITDAEINLNCGDVYIRQRIMSTGYAYEGDLEDVGDANENVAEWFCEDPHYSDYYISNWNNKGRIAIYSPFAKRQHLKSSIYHTNAFIDNTQINGLSRVEFFNNVALKEEQGGINKLIQVGDILKSFQDRKITSVYIQKAFALNGDGTNNVILSDKTFAGIRPHDDDYGTIHAGSVSRVENNVFFYDYYNSAFAVVTAGGVINICEQDKKFSKGVRDLTTRINNIYGGYNNANIWSHINRNNNEYTFYVSDKVSSNLPTQNEISVFSMTKPNQIILVGNYTSVLSSGDTIFIDGSSNPENNGSFVISAVSYNAGTGSTQVLVSNPPMGFDNETGPGVSLYYYGDFEETSGEGMSYSYERNRWITRLQHGVAFATQLGNRAYSTGGGNIFNFGELFEENYGGELSFLGSSRTQQLDFVFNDNPTVVKRFYTHLQQANYPFNVSVSVPANQTYPTGMASNIPSAVLKNQEGYYVSRYFRDLNDPAFTSPLEARVNGRELRGYVLKHVLTNSDTSVKKILMNVGVNFAASEPIIQ